MKHYGQFEMTRGDGGIAFFRSGDLDFYDMQAADLRGDEPPHFDQAAYFVVNGNRVVMASTDVGALVPDGDLWGGDVPAEVLAKPHQFTFDGAAFADYVEPHVARRLGSAREFLHLFTEAERLAFFAAKQASPALELWWAEASTGQFSLDHPSVAQGLAQLVAAGLLAEGRKAEILAADFDAVG